MSCHIQIDIIHVMYMIFRDAIPMESLELGENIGEGEFGSVHKAVYMAQDGEVQNVAVKVTYYLSCKHSNLLKLGILLHIFY